MRLPCNSVNYNKQMYRYTSLFSGHPTSIVLVCLEETEYAIVFCNIYRAREEMIGTQRTIYSIENLPVECSPISRGFVKIDIYRTRCDGREVRLGV